MKKDIYKIGEQIVYNNSIYTTISVIALNMEREKVEFYKINGLDITIRHIDLRLPTIAEKRKFYINDAKL